MGVGGQHHAQPIYPGKETRYPLYRRLGGPQGWSGRVREISPPPGVDPRTVQPVASRYTDWAIRNHTDITTEREFISRMQSIQLKAVSAQKVYVYTSGSQTFSLHRPLGSIYTCTAPPYLF
jgi:hypothetical protein